MKLLRIPLIVIFVAALVVGGACLARLTGIWPEHDSTRARPHQGVP